MARNKERRQLKLLALKLKKNYELAFKQRFCSAQPESLLRSVSASCNGQRYCTEIKTGRSHFPIPAPRRFLLNQSRLWLHTTQAARPLLLLPQSLLREWLCHLPSYISGKRINRTLVHGVFLKPRPGQLHTCICVSKRNRLVHLNQDAHEP